MARLHIRPGGPAETTLKELVQQAQAIARPKALYRLAYIDECGDDWVVLDGVKFKSRVMRVNLGDLQRVFAYVATCGVELAEWAQSVEDFLHRFWVDAIMEYALFGAMQALEADLVSRYLPGQLSAMNPGSLADWPLSEQQPLFELLREVKDVTGITLTDSMLMVPFKSVSGIFFATQETFASCQLCPRPVCPNRRAPYDPALFEAKYRQPA